MIRITGLEIRKTTGRELYSLSPNYTSFRFTAQKKRQKADIMEQPIFVPITK